MGFMRHSHLSRAAAFLLSLSSCDRVSRVELEPESLRLHARGQSASVRAAMWSSSGKPIPSAACQWSTADERVASVAGTPRDATVTAKGPGTTSVRCTAGSAGASALVNVRLASRVEVSPPRLEIRLGDEPAPATLGVAVLDTEGRPLLDRPASTRCEDERVCRGDDRGQVWPLGAGETRAVVEVDGASSAIPVRVVDVRSAAGRPRRVPGNPMLDVEKALAPPR
jgi:hypothetical protein